MRYRLRTLLIVLALGPPLLAGGYLVHNSMLFWIVVAAVVWVLILVAMVWAFVFLCLWCLAKYSPISRE
jgi:hypothetical protein